MKAKTAAIVALAMSMVAGCSSPGDSTATHVATTTTGTTTNSTALAIDAQSACADLDGTIDPDQICRIHDATPSYTLDMSFPGDYPESQPLVDFLTGERRGFVDWVVDTKGLSPSFPYELKVGGAEYRSATAGLGTQSLVFDVYSDAGIHPVTTYETFNYDLTTQTPITFETLFKPDAKPLDVLNPIVEELTKHDAAQPVSRSADDYRNFGITDDALTFYLNQDGLLPHADGTLTVVVPRSELASLLA